MIGKYINQFMADNELLVNEEFFIKNMDGNRVLIGCADRYKIEDIDGGILTAVVMNEKDKPPAMLLESALIDLLRENYFIEKKPFYPAVGERYYFVYKGGRKMIDYEKLLDALQTIQNECAKYKCCTDCPFFVQSEDINCGILSRNPVNWKLNKVHVIRLINQ